MSIEKVSRNRDRYRKVYPYGQSRKPDMRSFVDLLTNTTKSIDFQYLIRDRSYFLINGDMVLTYPTGSTVQYAEGNYHTTGAVEYIDVVFPSTFNQTPFISFRLYPEWILGSGSNVAYWATELATTGFRANFSAPFEGRLTYRAVYTDTAFPVYVERVTGSYAWVAGAEVTSSNQSSVTMSFGTLPGIPEEVFSNPVGLSTDSTLNIAQAYAAVGTSFVTANLSTTFSGFFNVIAISTIPTGSPQSVDPP